MIRPARDPRSAPSKRAPSANRRAAAAVELAVMLPLLCLIMVLTIDYSRLFVGWLTLAQAAYNGAYYQADATVQANCGFTSATQAALADTGDLSPSPTVGTTSGTDASGNAYVQVTVTWTFTTIFNYPGVPTSTTLTRTLRMAKTPT